MEIKLPKLPKIQNLRQKTKLVIILGVEFVVITLLIVLIFFAGKKSYTVTFDLNGGILISGEAQQRVTQGQSATPPNVAKFGHYLRGWSGSYKSVTRDVTVRAIWEYETSAGIEYSLPENTNYCQISGSFKEIQGDIYIGSYHESGRQVLGITEGAFKDRTGITGVYLLDGILSIGDEAFAGCKKLEVIEIPSTVVRIGKGAFAGCESLKEIILPDSLIEIEEGAFAGCSSLERVVTKDKLTTIGDNVFLGCESLAVLELAEGLVSIGEFAFSGCDSLTEVTLPESLENVGVNAFEIDNLTINLYISEENLPVGFLEGWHSDSAELVFDYIPPEEEEEDEGENNDGFWGDIL